MSDILVRVTMAAGVLFSAVITGCGRSAERGDRDEIVVFAAASTADAMEEIVRDFEASGGPTVRLSLAASSTLAQQIEAGAPAEVYLSANSKWMDYIEQRRLLADGSRRDLLANRIVLIAPRGRGFPVRMQPDFDLPAAFAGRLALGDPTHVPAGDYARAALQHMGWWDSLKDRLAPGADVRAALRYVELGEADAGVVYATDATADEGVERLATFPEGSHPPIRYPLALCKGAGHRARLFYEYLQSPKSAAVFEKFGFETVARR